MKQYKIEKFRDGEYHFVTNLKAEGWRDVTNWVRSFTVRIRVTAPDGTVRDYAPTYSGGIRKRFAGCRPVK